LNPTNLPVEQLQPQSGPNILEGRFVLAGAVRKGGMAIVQRAMDLQSGRTCAVKRMLVTPDERLWKESFYREQKALQDLRHPNIVEFIDCGYAADGLPYLVLEWVDQNLEEWIHRDGRISWAKFWPTIGRPLLDAIKTAQAANWIHRDIKPRNVLMDTLGTPKLSDYGIARDYSRVVSTYTLREFNSEPYSPPEKDDGSQYGFGRDLFSWTILAGFCLTGREPTDYGEVDRWIETCEDAPTEILRRAASMSREQRPRFAALLLQEIDEWVGATERSTTAPRCYVRMQHAALTYVRDLLGMDAAGAEQALALDFAEVQGARPDPDDHSILRLFGAGWLLVVRRAQDRPGVVEGIRARLLGPAEAERQRDAGYPGPISVIFGEPSEDSKAALSLDALFAEAAAGEEERELRWKGDPNRIFRAWHAYLSARYEFEAGKGNTLSYTDARVNGRTVSMTISDLLPPDIVGQDRMVRFGQGKFVAIEVQRANGDELTLTVVAGEPESLPRRGMLEQNTIRAEKALDRQRQALNAVMHRRSVNPALRDLIVDPSRAKVPGDGIKADDTGEKFDADKKVILEKALNLSEVLTVEGPPGTGKTRLIEEIIIQYLRKNPKHRILLSSQTHVALDNVIDRVRVRNSELDIIRVGRFDDARISAGAAELLLERKADAWSVAVRNKAQRWLADWAKRNGVDPKSVEAGMLSLRLGSLLNELTSLALISETLEEQSSKREADAQEDLVVSEESRRTDSETIAIATKELVRRNYEVAEQLDEIRTRLTALGGIAAELANVKDAQELNEFGEVLLGDSQEHNRCRLLMELQQGWLERVGRSSEFHAAMLASANVVAATCVGLASVRGIENVAFDLCIIDESSKATATELLVPLARSRRAILVGDPKQLPPFFEQGVLSSSQLGEFREEEIRGSVFDRFLAALPKACREELRHQHRMVAPIGNLISEVFYRGKLLNEKTKPDVIFPNFPKAITWLDTSGIADHGERRVGTSFVNYAETRAVRNVLQSLAFVAANRKRVKYSVAVIAGYQAQISAIESAIMDIRGNWSNLDVFVNTVDAFQGSEADVCIYSVVRSNPTGKTGFLREPPRLNVALSRGRDLLIVVGDHGFCSALGSELPIADVVRFGFEHPETFEVRSADVS
jgi:serine/threonine protein kinase